MNKTTLESTYKFILFRLKAYTEDDYKKEVFIFSDFSYRYIMQRLHEDGVTVEFEKIGDWEYKLRRVEFNNENHSIKYESR